MPDLAIGDIIAVSFSGTQFDQKTLNTLHYRCITAPIAGSIITGLDNFLTYVVTNAASPWAAFVDCCPSTWNVDEVSAQRITPGRTVRRAQVPVAAAGTRGATSSTNLSAVITKGTDFAGRSQIGSLHLPGIADGDQAVGYLVNGLKIAMGTLASKMLNVLTEPVTLGTYAPILYHPGATPNWSLLTSATPQETIRTMRRRTVGVGI